MTIDLNADLGEHPERLADDEALLALVTSANIACGGHAGDADSMAAVVAAAQRSATAVGAHPSYPDRANFGRLSMSIPAAALEASLREQIAALAAAAGRLGAAVSHIKPHGALYNDAARRADLAEIIGRAVLAVDPSLIVVGLAGARCHAIWRAMGLRTAAEAFADRRYEPDGSLRARSLPGALLETPAEVGAQALSIARDRCATAHDGARVPIHAETLCIHGDAADAVSNAAAVRRELEAAGVQIRRLGA